MKKKYALRALLLLAAAVAGGRRDLYMKGTHFGRSNCNNVACPGTEYGCIERGSCHPDEDTTVVFADVSTVTRGGLWREQQIAYEVHVPVNTEAWRFETDSRLRNWYELVRGWLQPNYFEVISGDFEFVDGVRCKGRKKLTKEVHSTCLADCHGTPWWVAMHFVKFMVENRYIRLAVPPCRAIADPNMILPVVAGIALDDSDWGPQLVADEREERNARETTRPQVVVKFRKEDHPIANFAVVVAPVRPHMYDQNMYVVADSGDGAFTVSDTHEVYADVHTNNNPWTFLPA